MRTIKATAYLTIEPDWRGSRLMGVRIAKLTQSRPHTGPVGAAVVKLTVELPERVFRPFEAEALAAAQEGDVGQVHVVIEPYRDDENDG